MKNKVYRIRNKSTGEFIKLGYSQKGTWLVYPYEAIRQNKDELSMEDYEVVVFEYKEIDILPLKENK